MKTGLILGASIAAVLAGPALAQSPTTADWAGVYVGANLAWPKADVEDNYDSLQLFSFKIDGRSAGLQLGYNLQSGMFVYGLEAGFSFGSVTGIGTCAICTGTSTQPDMEIDRTAALRARVGIANRNMLYFASLGVGRADARVVDPLQGGSDSQRHRGLLAGLGVDWKVSPALSVGAEYIYGRYEDIPYALIITPDVIGFETQELRLDLKLSF